VSTSITTGTENLSLLTQLFSYSIVFLVFCLLICLVLLTCKQLSCVLELIIKWLHRRNDQKRIRDLASVHMSLHRYTHCAHVAHTCLQMCVSALVNT